MRNWEECNERMTLESHIPFRYKSEEEGHLGRPPPKKDSHERQTRLHTGRNGDAL